MRARSEANRVPPAERMATCPATPNCVTSRAGDVKHSVEPLRFDDDPAAAWQRLTTAVASLPRTRIVVEEPDYLAAECTTRLFGFVDDLEFAFDAEAGHIQVRSASRVGYSDLGVNRRRVERVRALFEQPG